VHDSTIHVECFGFDPFVLNKKIGLISRWFVGYGVEYYFFKQQVHWKWLYFIVVALHL